MAQRLLPILLMVAAVFLIGDRLYSKEAAPQCAFISEVSGKAVVQRDGKYYLIRGMDGIYCGERVKVMAGAKVVAAECGANLKTEIVGPAEFTVERNKLIFKKGKAENPVKIDGELCPFFLAQSFVNPKLTQVDGRGNQLPPERYATFVMKSIAPSRPMTSEFFGYLSEIKGDVYFSQPSVL